VVIRPRARLHLARQHFILRGLPRGLVDERYIQALRGKVPQALGQLVGQIDLLTEPSDHDLEGGFPASATTAPTPAGATAARAQDEHQDDPGDDPQLSFPCVHNSLLLSCLAWSPQ